jgi:hypothetical protein
MSDLSLIEMKNENTSESESKKKTDWAKFGKSILSNLICTIILGFIGANFVYIMYADLDSWFPSDPSTLPYRTTKVANGNSFKDKISKMFSNFRGGSSEEINSENDSKNFCNNLENLVRGSDDKFKKLSGKIGLNEFGFPYSWDSDESGILNIIKSLFGKSAKYSYINSRGILKRVLKFFKGFETVGENLLFVLSLPILILLVLCQMPFIIGFVSTLFSFAGSYFNLMPANYGWILTIIITFFTMFLSISSGLLWSILIGMVQMIQLYVTLLVMPLFDIDVVREILYCKSHILLLFFVLLTILSAFNHLENILAIVMAVTLLVLTSYKWVKKN